MTDEKIQELFGQVPYFADTKIEAMPRELSPFKIYESWNSNGSVHIQRICGTGHPDYIGLTWRELLSRGRRMPTNLKLFRQNPDYYLNLGQKTMPSMHIHFYNGKGYVGEDGNHRTCIARFFLYGKDSPFLHGVRLSEMQTDIRMDTLFSEIKSLLPVWCIASPVSREVSREDGDGWAVHRYENSISLKNTRRNKVREFLADEAEQVLLPLLHHPFRRFLKLYREILA